MMYRFYLCFISTKSYFSDNKPDGLLTASQKKKAKQDFYSHKANLKYSVGKYCMLDQDFGKSNISKGHQAKRGLLGKVWMDILQLNAIFGI